MNSICNLENALIRRPLYSFKEYGLIPSDTEKLDTFINELWKDVIFKEALLLASSELYHEWEKLIISNNSEKSKVLKINFSILKYYIRITTRSTPFGLFSSYSDFKIEDEIASDSEFRTNEDRLERFTTFDLAFLYNLIRNINNTISAREILSYSINNSIYKIGDSYRYVEVLFKNNKREHVLTSLESDEVLDLIFSNCETPRTIHELSNLLVENVEEVTYNQVAEYINGLIDSQILKSNLDICLNETSPLEQILSFFEEHTIAIERDDYLKTLFSVLKKLKTKLNKLDETIGNDFEKYNEIYALVDQTKISYDKKFILNVNLRSNWNNQSLNSKDLKNIKKAIEVLSHFSEEPSNNNSNLVRFKEAFYKRYEEKEIPLGVALDNEVGIGYIQSNNENNDFSDLIDDIQWEYKESRLEEIKFDNKIHRFWNNHFNKGLKSNLKEIDLKNVDLSTFKDNSDKLSKTFSVMLNKTDDKIIIDSIGGSSSLNLITRFSSADSKLEKIIRQSVDFEKANEDIIYVELLHVPNDRHGNILLRKIDRKYELPYLTKSSKEAHSISIEDIYLSIKRGKIILKSKTLNKQIKIYNTTAHNFHYNSLPIYQFLCDLQYQDIFGGLSLNFGRLNSHAFNYSPRVIYGKNIVLSAASWRINYDDLKLCYNEKENIVNIKEFTAFKKEHNIPKHVYLSVGDNKLLIDTDNVILLQFVFEDLKKKKELVLTECLYDLTKDFSDNEIIVPFVNNNYIENSLVLKNETAKNIRSKFIPAEDWLYYKIYTGVKTANKVLVETLAPLVEILKEQGLIKKWFYIRYRDTDFHLRIRFAFNEKMEGSVQKIMELFNSYLKTYVENHLVWKIELATYDRELERYGWELIDLAETFFCRDSDLIIKLIQLTKERKEENALWMFSLKCIDGYLDFFKFSPEMKHKTMESLYNSFQQEFEAGKSVRKQIDTKYRTYLSIIKEILETKSGNYNSYVMLIDNSIKNLFEEMSQLQTKKAQKLINSFIHMHINRMVKSSPRAHELVMYGILEKYYRMKLTQDKYLTKSNNYNEVHSAT
ncbi:hypothetical protein AR687_18180 [Flavobacteriaceae bacterium CRH]|nr:hypothetical protein AR687_18180 [Flavobacteriaceae bacterium CRH]